MAELTPPLPHPLKEGIKQHLQGVASRADPSQGSVSTVMKPGEIRQPAHMRLAAQAAGQPVPVTKPPEPVEPEPTQPPPTLELPPTEEATLPVEPVEPPPERSPAEDRILGLLSKQKSLEEENAQLKQQLAPRPPPRRETTRPEKWDEMSDEEQIDHLVEERFNTRFGDILPTLHQQAEHHKLTQELGQTLAPGQLAAVNTLWMGGRSGLTVQEAAAIAANRDPTLFGESGTGGFATPPSVEKPAGKSPAREPVDPKEQLRENLLAARDPAARKIAGIELMKQKLTEAVGRVR